MTTAVPSPTFGTQGFVAPAEADVLAGVQADINTALGGGVNPGLSTPQGQIASTETAVIGDKNALFLWYTNQVDPALNSGRTQDAIGRIYYMTRIPGAPTVVQGTCSGLTGVVIPVGATVRAADENLYICQQQGTIPVGGSVVLPFACATNGPISCPADDEGWTIYQTIFGWDSFITLDGGILGRNVETRAEFEDRRSRSVAANAIGILDATLGSVLAVDGVLDAFVTENDESTARVVGGKILGPNSIYVAVLGGATQAIADVIWARKAPGAGFNGNTSAIVVDPNPEYLPPVPEYVVRFERPAIADIAVLVTLKSNTGIPTDALAQIQTAILAAFAGTDDGPRAKIGSTIFASRYYAGVATLGPWAIIVNIHVGLFGNGATFTASVNGNIMTVTSVVAGALVVGQLIQDDSLLLASGTTITAFYTGAGGDGTYQLSSSGQVLSTDTMRATNLVDRLTMNIDQAPTISPENVYLTTV